MKIIVVIPTYNERENISLLIDSLEEVFLKIPSHEFGILVVEGNSPDGTADVVREKMEKFKNVHLLVESKKAGLGAAYAKGFEYAIDNLRPDYLIEMDADFQHDPKEIVNMCTKIDDGYDYIIGSRFTQGGSIPSEWALTRKFFSVGGNLFSKVVLGIWNVTDFTSGFKASRVKGFVDKIDFKTVLSAGFAYKLDLLFKMYKLGARIIEIPITFIMRDRGNSKMERNNAIDSFKVVLLLKYNDNKNFFRFCIVGFAGLFTDTLLFNLGILLKISPSISAILSGFVAMMATFLLNNHWSFKEREIVGTNRKIFSIAIYFLSSSVPILVRSKIVAFFVTLFGANFLVTNVAFFIGIVFGLVWNFTVYSKIIWRK
jgi:dolichol-phosphate mannosyltransferase